MNSRKGQKEGLSVAFIIGAIMILVVLYVILAPVEVRQDLLDGNYTTDSYSKSGSEPVSESILLSTNPGKISKNPNNVDSFKVPEMNLYMKDKPEVSNLASSLEVYRSWFTKKYPILRFNVNDLENLKSATLFFAIEETDGPLNLYLNGMLIHDSDLSLGVESIQIPTEYLNGENELSLETRFPILPWSLNEHKFSEVSLKETFELVHVQEEKSLILSAEDLSSAEKANIKYTQLCNMQFNGEGTIQIWVNDLEVSDSTIACVNTQDSVPFPVTYLNPGENTIRFIITKGDFTFSGVNLEIISEQKKYPTYDFIIGEDDYDSISDGSKDMVMGMVFAEGDSKSFFVLVNGNKIEFSTYELSESVDISDYASQGKNTIQIIPINSFKMDALNINLN